MNTTAASPAPCLFTEALGQVAYALAEAQPFLPMYLHLILSALFPIFTGAQSSLVRPSSAAKPPKKAKKEQGKNGAEDDEDDEDDDEDYEELSLQKMEGLSPSDAIVFPLLAGSTLAGLYFLIKWMGPQIINKILGWYFSSIGVFSVAKLLNDSFAVLETFCWPEYYADKRVIWQVQSSTRSAVEVGKEPGMGGRTRKSPLPGMLGRLKLPPSVLSTLWYLRDLPSTRYSIRVHLAKVISFRVKLTLRTIFSTILGLAVVLIANFVSKAWYLTNIQGFAFSYSALQLMSPTTFPTGSLILAALFFYDIYFVFFTPMMVTVATNLDVPIKLLFPRPAAEGQTAGKLAMLGLGDIVLPGIMIGLALRFDLYMHYLKKQRKQGPPGETSVPEKDQPEEKQDVTANTRKEKYRTVTGHWGNSFWTSSWTGRSLLFATPPKALQQSSPALRRNLIPNFSKPYFYASIVGYVIGMCTTLGIMQVYHHAQPALLYLVPGVLASLWLTGAARGELKQMWNFSEAIEEDVDEKQQSKSRDEKDQAQKKESTSWWGSSFFSSSTRERNAKQIEKQISKSVSRDGSDSTNGSSATPGAEGVKGGNDASKEKKQKATPKEFFLFSVTRLPPRRTKSNRPTKTSAVVTDSDDAVIIGDAGRSSAEDIPRWRGARVSEESKVERPEKRLRTS